MVMKVTMVLSFQLMVILSQDHECRGVYRAAMRVLRRGVVRYFEGLDEILRCKGYHYLDEIVSTVGGRWRDRLDCTEATRSLGFLFPNQTRCQSNHSFGCSHQTPGDAVGSLLTGLELK